ncbi:thymidylate synthase [Vibrio phage vB_VpaS_sm030]|nr:thymidylate synthase [Vibrio phage vB_VpaS_sm030]CAI5930380.1 thymidylate synthase [Vibrio phage vB_VpaS_sm030]CAI6013167.1 thymidylate synthase [Vibrio phage vB_VpaS_sm030]
MSNYHSLTVESDRLKTFTVYGGSFKSSLGTKTDIRVCLAPEIGSEYRRDATFNIEDFSAPRAQDLNQFLDRLIADIEVRQANKQRPISVYIGCLGGIGRTGLVIAALLIKLQGLHASEAINVVRRTIHPYAVETYPQVRCLNALAKMLNDPHN